METSKEEDHLLMDSEPNARSEIIGPRDEGSQISVKQTSRLSQMEKLKSPERKMIPEVARSVQKISEKKVSIKGVSGLSSYNTQRQPTGHARKGFLNISSGSNLAMAASKANSALPRITVAKEDFEQLEKAEGQVERMKEFKKSQVEFSLPKRIANLEEGEATEPDDLDQLLQIFESIIQADPASKRAVEMESTDKIARVIRNKQQGEACCDFVKFLSNLKRHFNDGANLLESLVKTARPNYDTFVRASKVQLQAIADNRGKMEKLNERLVTREKEVQTLRDQLQQLLTTFDNKKEASPISQQKPQKAQSVMDDQKSDTHIQIDALSKNLENALKMSDRSSSQGMADALGMFDKLKLSLSNLVKDYDNEVNQNLTQLQRMKNLEQNSNFLEQKIATTIATNEEEQIALKTQMVIYKEKAKSYKTKLKVELDEFKNKMMEKEKEGIFKEKKNLERTVIQLEQQAKVHLKQIEELHSNVQHYRKRYNKLETQYEERLDGKEHDLQDLEQKMLQLQNKHGNEMKERGARTVNLQMKMQLEEKEKNLKELRLRFMQNNQKKLMAQKQFIEKQLQKDKGALTAQMTRIELEIKKDDMIKTTNAVARMRALTKSMTDSYVYIQQVVSFMVFDQENNYEQPEDFDEAQLSKYVREQQSQEGDVPQRSDMEISRNRTINLPDNEDKANPSGLRKTRPGSSRGRAQSQGPVEVGTLATFDPKNCSMDKLVASNPYDLIAMLLNWMEENFQGAGTPISNDFTQLQQSINPRINQTFLDSLTKQLLQQSRIHFSQHSFKVTSKVKSLESERNTLNDDLQHLKKENAQLTDSLEIMRNGEVPPVAPTTLDASEGESNEEQRPSTRISGNMKNDFENDYKEEQQDFGHQGANSYEEAIGMLQRENEALRLRIKEVRLVLNKQINELQETLNVARTSYDAEITRSKLQYGKDLGKLSRKFERDMERQKKKAKESQEDAVRNMQAVMQQEMQRMRVIKEKEIAEKEYLFDDSQQNYLRVQQEVKKLKAESSDLYKGGWGTFSLAFENPMFFELQSKVDTLQTIQQQFDIYKSGLKQKKTKHQKSQITKFEAELKILSEDVQNTRKQMEHIEIHPVEKLRHFIEVGFQIGALNFQHTHNYNEQTYESMLRKYVFEFQQSMTQSNFQQLINKIRKQISDNFALFNEINPIYITLNLGRPACAFVDKSKPIEDFHLIDRKVVQVTGRILAINFLKCDEPLTYLRIVAYSNKNGRTYSLDLNKGDLLMLVEGNQKIIEEENMPDLCQLISNSLTLIQRKIELSEMKQKDKNEFDELLNEEVLAVEHRLFFNELFRQNWDARNKKIRAKHDKHLQGLLADECCQTDFNKAIVYEAFNEVYDDQFALNLIGSTEDQADHFSMILKRGAMSGHFKLDIKVDYTEMEHTLYLLEKNEPQVRGQSHEISSAIVKAPMAPGASGNEALAYVFSMEKIFGRDDVIVIKVVSIQRRYAESMQQFEWDPQKGSVVGSTAHTQEVFYLVRRLGEPLVYNRVFDFEILNTEIRTQLFTHAFGYEQQAVDFSNVGLLGTVDQSKLTILNHSHGKHKRQSSPEKHDSSKISLRDSGVIGSGNKLRPPSDANHLKQPLSLDDAKVSDILIMRRFCIIRVQTREKERLGSGRSALVDQSESDGGDSENYESQFASVTLKTTEKLMKTGVLIVNVLVPELKNAQVQAQVLVTDLISIEDLPQIHWPERKDELCQRLLERLVTTRTKEAFTHVFFDPDIQVMSEVMREFRQAKFDQMMTQSNFERIELEVPNPAVLGITQIDLQESPKEHQVTLITHRPFKFTCYFLTGLKNFKPRAHKLFDWQALYLEAYQPSRDRKFIRILTEQDLISISDTLQQTMEFEGLPEDAAQAQPIIYRGMSTKQVVRLAKDLLHFDAKEDDLQVSLSTLRMQRQERKQLEDQFIESGGRYIWKVAELDPELTQFQTSVPRVEYKKMLITNEQKDFSQSQVNVEISECRLDSMPGCSKIQVDINDINERTLIYRTEVFSPHIKTGKSVHMERINFEQFVANQDREKKQTTTISPSLSANEDGEDNEDDDKGMDISRKGYVLTISEASLPHEFSFMLLEPESYTFWQYTYRDDKLNQIEGRMTRQAFVQHMRTALELGLLRNMELQNVLKVDQGFQTLLPSQSKIPVNLLKSENKLEDFSPSLGQSGQDRLVYGRTVHYAEDGYAEVRVLFSPKFHKIKLTVAQIEEPKNSAEDATLVITPKNITEQIQLLILDQPQSAFRYLQGRFSTIPLMYTIEQVSSMNSNLSRDRAIRVSMTKVISETETQSVLDLVLTDPSIIATSENALIKREKQIFMEVIYRDALTSLEKMENIQHEFVRCTAQLAKENGVLAKMEEPPAPAILWKMVYRRVINNKDSQANYVVNVLRGVAATAEEVFEIISAKEAGEQTIKVVAFETTTKTEEVFMFKLKEVLTVQELNLYAGDTSKHMDLFKNACVSRLKIRELADDQNLIGVGEGPNNIDSSAEPTKKRFMVYYVDPIVANLNFEDKEDDKEEREGSSTARKLLQKEFSLFDIRQGFHLPLIQKQTENAQMLQSPRRHQASATDSVFDALAPTPGQNKSLVCQLERGDLMFDVYQIHNPLELTLQVSIFSAETFKQICSATVSQRELEEELDRDRMIHLLEGHNKEKLARYLVQNTHYDERRELIYFLRSPESLNAPNEDPTNLYNRILVDEIQASGAQLEDAAIDSPKSPLE